MISHLEAVFFAAFLVWENDHEAFHAIFSWRESLQLRMLTNRGTTERQETAVSAEQLSAVFIAISTPLVLECSGEPPASPMLRASSARAATRDARYASSRIEASHQFDARAPPW